MAENEDPAEVCATSDVLSGSEVEINRPEEPEEYWVSKPISESITDAMEATPIGHQYELLYAVLTRRLKKALTEGSPLAELMQNEFSNASLNFRALNPTFLGNPHTARQSTNEQISNTQRRYQSRVWGSNSEAVLPTTEQLPVGIQQEVAGSQSASRGTLIAKLFHDLRHHIPLVLFNVVGKQYIPINVGGSSHGRMFRRADGSIVKELVYQCVFTVEAVAVTYDDTSTSNLQSIIEMTFGTLRDEIDDGPIAAGKRWRLTLPTTLTPSGIQEVDAPWASGDKDNKLYTSTVGLENLNFEGIGYVKAEGITEDFVPASASVAPSIRLVSDPDPDGPIVLKLNGGVKELSVTGLPIRGAVAIAKNSKGRAVADLQSPAHTGGGRFRLLPRRVGTATIRMFKTGGYVPQDGTIHSGKPNEVLVEREVTVIP